MPTGKGSPTATKQIVNLAVNEGIAAADCGMAEVQPGYFPFG